MNIAKLNYQSSLVFRKGLLFILGGFPFQSEDIVRLRIETLDCGT